MLLLKRPPLLLPSALPLPSLLGRVLRRGHQLRRQGGGDGRVRCRRHAVGVGGLDKGVDYDLRSSGRSGKGGHASEGG